MPQTCLHLLRQSVPRLAAAALRTFAPLTGPGTIKGIQPAAKYYWIDDRDPASNRNFAFLMPLFSLGDTGGTRFRRRSRSRSGERESGAALRSHQGGNNHGDER